jgi:hypothetical protein
LNPEDGGVIESFEDWEYSSHRNYFNVSNNPLLSHRLIELSYSEILKEYLARRKEKEFLLTHYMLD